MGNGALPHGPSYRAHPRLYLFVESLQRTNSGAIGGTADMARARRARRSDAFDPQETLDVHCGNGFNARFEPYQRPRLSRYNAGPELGSGYAAARGHKASRWGGGVAARGAGAAAQRDAAYRRASG